MVFKYFHLYLRRGFSAETRYGNSVVQSGGQDPPKQPWGEGGIRAPTAWIPVTLDKLLHHLSTSVFGFPLCLLDFTKTEKNSSEGIWENIKLSKLKVFVLV